MTEKEQQKIWLSPDHRQRLSQLAAERGVPMSRVVEELIDAASKGSTHD